MELLDTYTEYYDSIRDIFWCISSDQFYHPKFKELSIDMRLICVTGNLHCPNLLLELFHGFFSSPYPVRFSLTVNFWYLDFNVLPGPLPFNYDRPSKCLQLKGCSFSPNFASLLPPCIALKSLTLDNYWSRLQVTKGSVSDTNILHAFASLTSINIESITVHVGYKNIMDLCSLITSIVTAKELNIFVEYVRIKDDHQALTLSTALYSIKAGCIRSFGIVNSAGTDIFEAVF